MSQSIKKEYRLVVDPNKELFRWKVDAYPALIFAVCRGMMKSPYGWPKSEGFFFGHDFYWYDEWRDIWDNGNRYIKDYLSDSRGDFPKSYYREYNRVFKELRKRLRELKRINFSKINQTELRREWFNFFNFYTYDFWMVVTISETLSYAASHRMEKEIIKSGVKLSPEEISQLTVFPERSFLMIEEYELFKIASVKSVARRRELLQRHFKKFYWLLNGYHGVKELNEKFFADRLLEISKNKERGVQFNHLKNYSSQVAANFRRLVRRYRLNSEIVKYAKLAQRSSYLQDKRKGISFIATEYIIKMYYALAQFLKISREESLYILWSEFDDFLRKRKSLSEIIKRQKRCRLRMTHLGTEISLFDTETIFKIFEEKYSAVTSQEVKGIVAHSGIARGRIKIIRNRREINDFKVGQILVALMTSPDYIVAIKKAKAIITDDGGLTCHAAIVARELKKPCIVGTKNATRVLHDGDLVEVDAKKGIVKILKNRKQ